MTPDVKLHPDALQELHYAARWYESQTYSLRNDYLSDVDRAINFIKESPTTWPLYVNGTRRFLLRRFPFAIVYRYRRNSIEILAVMHLRRHPNYWMTRDKP